MENDFYNVMLKHSDAELVKIITKYRNEYNPDAIIAAEQEIKNRKLSIKDFEIADKEIANQEEIIKNKAKEPLELHWKILTFLLPGIINIFIASTLKVDGYNRKFKEAWKYTLWGFVFYFACGFLVFVLFVILLKLQII